jgi:antitoxin component of MazEF toxin-antitoxin module
MEADNMASMAGLVRKLCRIGNSQGIILTRTILELLNWDNYAEVELKIDGNKLIIVPHRQKVRAVAERVFDNRPKLSRKRKK